MQPPIRNIGILAHVDAGKTSITEHFLHLSGKTNELGSVDAGTSKTDFLEVEKERGISVKSAGVSFTYQNTKINLIDTPGHVDFSAEVLRVLPILDAAIVVISAVEGVQSHTETIWKVLEKNKVPTLFFINKIDRAGADHQRVMAEIQKELTNNVALLQDAENVGLKEVTLNTIDELHPDYSTFVETIADKDEVILEAFLEDESISYSTIQAHLPKLILEAELVPVLLGSAKYGLGVDNLLKAVIDYLPAPKVADNEAFSAKVFQIEHLSGLGRVAHVKMLSGSLRNRDVVKNATLNTENKLTRLGTIFSGKFSDTDQLSAGDIGCLCGLPDAEVGHVLGTEPEDEFDVGSFSVPLLKVRVFPVQEKEYSDLANALQLLTAEDPSLNFEWFRDEQELTISTMGKVQLEILEQTIQHRFRIATTFGDPTVVYKETPATIAEGTERYTMPKPCWAVVTFQVAPGERGSGITYRSDVGVNDIHRKYQNEVRDVMQNALKQGIKGWEVTDIEVTLTAGEDHEMHSRPGDFKIATAIGILTALTHSETKLLEPIWDFKITASEDLLGAITGDIVMMRGTFDSPEMNDGNFILRGSVPVATSMEYAVKLASRSGGKAKLSLRFKGYELCPEGEGSTREYKGIHPLDRSKYILWARRAIQ